VIFPCPVCRGRVAIDVFEQRLDGACRLCGGLGKLNTESMCRCGRPAVKVSGNVETCLNAGCIGDALRVQAPVSKVEESDDDVQWGNWPFCT